MEAMDEISDTYLAEAASVPIKKRKPQFLYAIAAAAAVFILIFSIILPISPNASAVAVAKYPGTTDLQYRIQAEPIEPALLQSFVNRSSAVLLADDHNNVVYSPLNLYNALSMLAECTGGNSRDQLLTLLDAENMSSLRQNTSALWKSIYWDDGSDARLLANSLWLDEDISCHQGTANLLAQNYYASTYRADFGSPEGNQQLQTWLNEQTENLLQQQAATETLPPNGILALSSTVYYHASWLEPFDAAQNVEGFFHGSSGEEACTYVTKEDLFTQHYQADNFTAITLPLTDGSTMWLILPNEGSSAADAAANPQLSAMFAAQYDYPTISSALVHLQMPKFDVSSQLDLKENLQKLGVTDLFDSRSSDFSTMFPGQTDLFLDKVSHANRVTLDENGVSAASYTLAAICGAALPETQIDFILDRPFLFAITTNGHPLFMGVINTMQ